MQSNGRLERFVPLDVSDTTLWEASTALAEEYPGLAVHAVVGDFHRHLDRCPPAVAACSPSSAGPSATSIPGNAGTFLLELGRGMTPDDRLLLGTDLVKDRATLVSAYDDAAGVTAEFNRNVLHVLNRELGADFDPERFAHVALWNEEDHRIEMWLRSTEDQHIRVADLDLDLSFGDGEEMLTEISTKFTPEALEAELRGCGFEVECMWPSDGDEFLLTHRPTLPAERPHRWAA